MMRATLNVPRQRRSRNRINLYPGLKYCPRCTSFRRCEDFGIDDERRDGLSGWCRPCRAGESRRRRASDGFVASRAECKARYDRNPMMYRAHVAVGRALKAGRIEKPVACPTCGRVTRIEAHHHRGYERKYWLDVVWRCRQCHRLEHTRGPLDAERAA